MMPVRGSISNLSLLRSFDLMREYVTLPLEPVSGSTAFTWAFIERQRYAWNLRMMHAWMMHAWMMRTIVW